MSSCSITNCPRMEQAGAKRATYYDVSTLHHHSYNSTTANVNYYSDKSDCKKSKIAMSAQVSAWYRHRSSSYFRQNVLLTVPCWTVKLRCVKSLKSHTWSTWSLLIWHKLRLWNGVPSFPRYGVLNWKVAKQISFAAWECDLPSGLWWNESGTAKWLARQYLCN